MGRLRCQSAARSRPFQCLRTHSCHAQLRPLAQHAQVAQHEQRVQLGSVLGQPPVPLPLTLHWNAMERVQTQSRLPAQVDTKPRTVG